VSGCGDAGIRSAWQTITCAGCAICA
jgi:hypothetical protein